MIVWAQVCVCLCVCTAIKPNLLSGGGASINNLTGETNKPENMGCPGDAVLLFKSQTCLIAFTASRAAHPELSTSYARQIFITAAIDFNCVVNRLTAARLSASPSFSSPSSLCIDSYFSNHLHLPAPITFLARPALQQSAIMCRECRGSCRCEEMSRRVGRFGATLFLHLHLRNGR